MKSRATAEGVLAVALAIVVIAAAAVLGAGHSGEADLRTSSWVDDRRGAHALHLLLETLGLAPERILTEPSADLPTDRTILVLAPSWPVTKPEAAALLDWVERGGRLVVVHAASVPPALTVDVGVLLTPLGLESRPASGAAFDVKIADDATSRAVRDVEWPALHVLGRIAPPAPPDPKPGGTPDAAPQRVRDARAGDIADLVTNPEGTLVARVPFGAGEILAVADALLFVNERLDEEDNAILAVALLAPKGRGPVTFDEFHHGFTPTGTRDGLTERIASLVVSTWIGRALIVLGLAGLVHAAGAAIRLGAPIAEPALPRRSLREHADALGRLFEGARASREALTILVDGARRSVASRAGAGPGASADALAARLDRSLAPGAGDLAAAVRAAQAATSHDRVEDAEFARLAANLGAAKRRFLHGGV